MPQQKQHRNTQQRMVILEELQKINTHPTATDLYQIVRCRLPKISLGTVYRNLDLLCEVGTIEKLDLTGREARFDGNLERHDHVRCIHCGRLDDVHDVGDNLVGEEPKQLAGYEILGRRLEFLGICPDCKSQQATAKKHSSNDAEG